MMGASDNAKTENDLVQAARRGERSALNALAERHQQRVFSFGMKMCGDVEDAREVAQETLLTMVRSLRDFRGEAAISTWLYTVARSFCIKRRRRSKGEPAQHESLDQAGQAQASAPGPSPEQALLGRETRDAVASALDHLEPEAREVVVLRDIEGLTAPEVAMVTGMSVAAVKSCLHRARQALRQQLLAVVGGDDSNLPALPNCPDVLTLLSKKLENDVSPDLCAEMERHVDGCPHCKGLCDSLKRTLAVCKSFPSPSVPPEVQESLRKAVQEALDERGSA
jgi:RNA polymerase sigma-70 factor (ECF subfamily)